MTKIFSFLNIIATRAFDGRNFRSIIKAYNPLVLDNYFVLLNYKYVFSLLHKHLWMWKELEKKKRRKTSGVENSFCSRRCLKKWLLIQMREWILFLLHFLKKTLYLLMKRVIHKGEKLPNQLIVYLNKVSNAWSY